MSRERFARAATLLVVVPVSAAATSWLVGRGFAAVEGNQMAPWILGRAAGVASYLLLVALVAMGLVLSHPWRSRARRPGHPGSTARLRLHVSLAVFTAAFTTLHVVVLATDPYAGVGWVGALVPLRSEFRPVPVTLGLIGLYAGLLAGLTAALAGRLAARVWWPIHKVAAVSLVLVWAHGVLAGSDLMALRWLYLGTAAAVVALAISRYGARTPADLVDELTSSATSLPRSSRPVREATR